MSAERALDIADRVIALAGQLGGGQVVRGPLHYRDVAALLARSRNGLRAVRLLLGNGLAHEAFVLARGLFSESLLLAEVAAGDERHRARILLGWEKRGLLDLQGLYEEADRRGNPSPLDAAAVQQRLKAIDAAGERFGVNIRRWKLNEKQLADRHGRGDGLLDYELASQFVHGSAFALNEELTLADGMIVIGAERAEPSPWSEAVALSAVQSVLYAIRSVCEILAWEEPPEVAELLATLDQRGSEMKVEADRRGADEAADTRPEA